jgi:uncharacterized protein (DUF488 family)
MLYTIGYQDKDIDFFIQALKANNIEHLVDVRSKSMSRLFVYNKKALENRLIREGIAYTWAGATLGGLNPILEKEIKRLALWQANKTVCLLCMEADPHKCHRHYEIGERLKKYNVTTLHI